MGTYKEHRFYPVSALFRFSLLMPWLVLGLSETASATDLTANVGLAYRDYTQAPSFTGQNDGGFSLRLQGELREKWNEGYTVLTLAPFYRQDEMDDERSHGDIRQFDLVHSGGDWEYQVGVGKVFWGVAESQHLVDVINQTDAIESLDGEEKLGQPLLRLGYFLEGGAINFFVLPYFRERTFPGEAGRLRFSIPVNTDRAIYESAQEEQHVDYAVRVQKMLASVDIGLSYFDGTARAPDFIPDFTANELLPYYRQMEQTGVDIQYTGDKWLWKLEAIYRHFSQQHYYAQVGGFEYTLPGVLGSNIELGLIAEYHYDSRGDLPEAPFQDDIFIGTRWVFNDVDADCLVGAFYDRPNGSSSFLVEFSARLSNQVQLNIEAQAFANIDQRDAFYDFRRDDFIEFEVNYFF